MLENKAQNSSGKQALIFTKFHALTRVIKEGYLINPEHPDLNLEVEQVLKFEFVGVGEASRWRSLSERREASPLENRRMWKNQS